MIQRIQSLYLLVAALLNSLLFFIPLNEMISGDHILRLSVQGLYDVTTAESVLISDLFALMIIVIISTALAFISIFLYKNRKLQMRMALYNSILELGITFLTLYFAYQIATTHETTLGFSIGLIIPIIGSVLSYLAFRAIKKDDDLVKSVDRIR